MDRIAAEDEQRKQSQRDRDVRDDRARQRRVDRLVQQFRHRHLLVAPQNFANTIVNDDRIVQRVAENRQQRRDAGEIEIDLRHRHEADRQHDVVDIGDHGAECELPFESEPQIDQDAEDREHQAEHAIGQQLAGDTRTDDFDAAIFDGVAKRGAHLLNGSLLRGIAARLLRDADQHVCGSAELLQLNFAEAEAAERRAERRNIGGSGFALNLKQRAAAEVDAEIQTMREEQNDRGDRQQRRDRKTDPAKPREVELGVIRDDPDRRQQIEDADDGQRDDESTEAQQNVLCGCHKRAP